jgi:hypothetical protein
MAFKRSAVRLRLAPPRTPAVNRCGGSPFRSVGSQRPGGVRAGKWASSSQVGSQNAQSRPGEGAFVRVTLTREWVIPAADALPGARPLRRTARQMSNATPTSPALKLPEAKGAADVMHCPGRPRLKSTGSVLIGPRLNHPPCASLAREGRHGREQPRRGRTQLNQAA